MAGRSFVAELQLLELKEEGAAAVGLATPSRNFPLLFSSLSMEAGKLGPAELLAIASGIL